MKIVSMLLALFLVGCAFKQPVVKPVLVTIKTPKIALNATGFLRQKGSGVELELYDMGQAIGRLLVSKRICLDGGCMEAKRFVSSYLTPAYPKTILKNILLARPIFEGLGMRRYGSGFMQRIRNEDLDIIYRIDGEIYFKDRKNRILIKIKELDG